MSVDNGQNDRPVYYGDQTGIWIFGAGLILCLLVAASTGAFDISLLDLVTGAADSAERIIFLQIRLPRLILAVLVGGGLAIAGAALQGLLRNPLADPGLIGISSGAALAVAMVIVLAGDISGFLGLYGLALAAFGGGILACLFVFRIAARGGAMSVTFIILAGIAINAMAGAATGFMTFLSDDEQLRALTFWTMGGLGGALWPAVILVATVILPSSIMLMRLGRQVNLVLMGETEAIYMGIDPHKLKKQVLVLVSLIVGTAVAVSGIIGFVGLVVPHLIRLWISPDNRVLFPASALLGAILLLLADTLSRSLLAPTEIPVGIITSLIGGPFFLWLLMRQFRKEVM